MPSDKQRAFNKNEIQGSSFVCGRDVNDFASCVKVGFCIYGMNTVV